MEQLIKALAEQRAVLLDNKPLKDLPADRRELHLRTAVAEGKMLNDTLSQAGLVLLPRELAEEMRREIVIANPVEIAGEVMALSPALLQIFYAAIVEAVHPTPKERERDGDDAVREIRAAS